MDKKELKEFGTIFAALVSGTAVARGVRNGCDRDIVGTVGGLIAGAATAIGVCRAATALGFIGNSTETTTEEVFDEKPETEVEEA